jgi:hypothetical protein
MNKQYVGRDFSKAQSTDVLTPDKVDAAADSHMPLCMKVRVYVCLCVFSCFTRVSVSFVSETILELFNMYSSAPLKSSAIVLSFHSFYFISSSFPHSVSAHESASRPQDQALGTIAIRTVSQRSGKYACTYMHRDTPIETDRRIIEKNLVRL